MEKMLPKTAVKPGDSWPIDVDGEIVELRDKLEGFGEAQAVAMHSAAEEDVISALTNLGYQRAAAEKAVERSVASAGRDNFDAMFRTALGALSK